MIHRYLKWSETANYNIKKNNSRNQNLQGSTMGGGQGSTIISRTHSRTLEFTPRGGTHSRHFVLEGMFFPHHFFILLSTRLPQMNFKKTWFLESWSQRSACFAPKLLKTRLQKVYNAGRPKGLQWGD